MPRWLFIGRCHGHKVRSCWVSFQSSKVELVMQSIANHSERGLSLIPANVGRSVSLSRWIPSSSLRDHHPDGLVVFFETALEGCGLSLRVFRSLRVLGEVEFSSREFAC